MYVLLFCYAFLSHIPSHSHPINTLSCFAFKLQLNSTQHYDYYTHIHIFSFLFSFIYFIFHFILSLFCRRVLFSWLIKASNYHNQNHHLISQYIYIFSVCICMCAYLFSLSFLVSSIYMYILRYIRTKIFICICCAEHGHVSLL